MWMWMESGRRLTAGRTKQLFAWSLQVRLMSINTFRCVLHFIRSKNTMLFPICMTILILSQITLQYTGSENVCENIVHFHSQRLHQQNQAITQEFVLTTQIHQDTDGRRGYHLRETVIFFLQIGLHGHMHLLAVCNMVRICGWLFWMFQLCLINHDVLIKGLLLSVCLWRCNSCQYWRSLWAKFHWNQFENISRQSFLFLDRLV